ncbi:MAG: primosomal protein N' [Woeseiaceae bacterium]
MSPKRRSAAKPDQAAILRVAVNAPLARLFDYLPPAGVDAGRLLPGCRLLVPFGRRRVTALLMETAERSDLPRARLRPALALLDDDPVLGRDDLWLIRFTSDYYHHPIGEVAWAALPALLRAGKPLYAVTRQLAITDEGRAADLGALRKRAPRQAELLERLGQESPVEHAALDAALPGWRRIRRQLLAGELIAESETREAPEPPPAAQPAQKGPPLNADQTLALAAVRESSGFAVTLLDGVTGSGKTEIYLRLVEDVLNRGRQVLVLVPEIGLTPQLLRRFERRFGFAPAVLHSALTDLERLAAWRAAAGGAAAIVLGTRSAVFVPLARPGLIIIDEEHDSSLKQQEGLRYSARDLAVARAKELGVPIVLGSATPSLESLQRCREGAYRHVLLPSRAGTAVPPLVRLVDLSRASADEGLSPTVVQAIRDTLAARGQVLVFLNRRGFAPTLICSACSHIVECERCDARLTVHVASNELLCHHCGAMRRLETVCRQCGGACRPLGQGTERIEDTLRVAFPNETITRIDSDSTRLKGTMDKALAQAAAGEAQILVGTQMLSKGHHFPNLALVVVVNADQGLFSTDFRGSERLAQSLIQVAGRAGREKKQGRVCIQTAYPQHPFWNELLSGGYERFAASELTLREAAAWPPFSRLALLRASAVKREAAWQLLEDLRRLAGRKADAGLRVLGPVSAPMERRAGRYRCQLLLQSRHRQPLHELLAELRGKLESSPLARRVRWSIDVDPIELF